MYKVFFKKSASRELSRLPFVVIKRVKNLVEQLENNPQKVNSKRLTGFKGLYRVRIGDYRVVYLVDKTIKIVTITKIGHRRGVYRRLS